MTLSPRLTITNRITAALTRIERARGFLDAARLSEEWIDSMREQALILEAHHTTHIEGTELTLDQSKRLLLGQDLSDARPDDVRELLNYRDAFELVAGYLGSGAPITESLVREIHARLVRGVRGDAARPGAYRIVQNYVVSGRTGEVVYTPPPSGDVPFLMGEFIDWLGQEQELNPVLVAGIAQFQLVHIHPFLDGNGRSARLLSTLCLYRAGYDFKQLFTISAYYDRDRASYYDAIRSVRSNEMDLTGWLEYFTDGLATQMREVQVRGEEVIRHDLFLSNARSLGLNERQLKLLSFLMERGGGAVAECEAELGILRRTLQRDLKQLVEKDLITAVGSGPFDPSRRYEPKL